MDDLSRQRAAAARFWREDVTERPAGEWAVFDGVQVHTTGLSPRHWNGAFWRSACDLDGVLPEVAAWFAERDKPWGLLVPAEAHVEPPGLSHAADQRVMLRGTGTVPAAPLPARVRISADAPASDVALVQAEAFGDMFETSLAFVTPTLTPTARPPQTTLTAHEGREPVGCATVAIMDDVAGVFGVSVREAWRRRGLGAALTAAVMRVAADAGCDLLYLNPSELGYGVYAQLGFIDASPFHVWVPD
jgi:predicted N-acetyltransferase YhbS